VSVHTGWCHVAGGGAATGSFGGAVFSMRRQRRPATHDVRYVGTVSPTTQPSICEALCARICWDVRVQGCASTLRVVIVEASGARCDAASSLHCIWLCTICSPFSFQPTSDALGGPNSWSARARFRCSQTESGAVLPFVFLWRSIALSAPLQSVDCSVWGLTRRRSAWPPRIRRSSVASIVVAEGGGAGGNGQNHPRLGAAVESATLPAFRGLGCSRIKRLEPPIDPWVWPRRQTPQNTGAAIHRGSVSVSPPHPVFKPLSAPPPCARGRGEAPRPPAAVPSGPTCGRAGAAGGRPPPPPTLRDGARRRDRRRRGECGQVGGGTRVSPPAPAPTAAGGPRAAMAGQEPSAAARVRGPARAGRCVWVGRRRRVRGGAAVKPLTVSAYR